MMCFMEWLIENMLNSLVRRRKSFLWAPVKHMIENSWEMKVAVGSLPVDDARFSWKKCETPETYRQHSSKNFFFSLQNQKPY